MPRQLKYFIAIILAVLFCNCVKKKTYTNNPEIEFKNFTNYSPGVVDVVVGFKDGDGDIGKDQEDQSKNVFTKLYKRNSDTSKFILHIDPIFAPDSITPFTIRKDAYYNPGKPILGDIGLNFDLNAFAQKRFKWEIYIVDNAGNKSNMITTPELIIP